MEPNHLYHYTSIDNLALILNSKRIMFNNLKNVDDLSEGESTDIKDIGQYYFISCWTDMEEESIPFWNMYTTEMRGVRLKMPTNFLKLYEFDASDIKGLDIDMCNSIAPREMTFTDDYWMKIFDSFPQKVIYTNNEEELTPKVLNKATSGEPALVFNYDKIASYKSEHWRFQSEWRYIIIIMPNTERFEDNIGVSSIISMFSGEKIPFKTYFAEIDDEKFKDMTIKLGPRHTESDRLIVESLINKFNPTAKLEVSDLYGRIK